MKKILLISLVLAAVLGVFAWVRAAKRASPPPSSPPAVAVPSVLSDASFVLEGRKIALKDGRYEESLAGSAVTMTTSLTEWKAEGDLDGDGRPDAAAVVADDPGEGRVFYYALAVLDLPKGLLAVKPVFLGDFIVVNGLSILDGKVVVKIRARRTGLNRTLRFAVRNGALVEAPAVR